MIDGKYADYHGETFKVVEMISNDVVLVTEDERALDLGFEAKTIKHSKHTLYFKLLTYLNFYNFIKSY